MKIVVGLGNPGDKYKNTRHNAGWLFLDNIIGDVTWQTSKKFNALIFEKDDIVFVKPLTFMNNSGQSVRKIMDYYGLIPKKLGLFNKKDEDLNESLTVIQDDIDIDLGVDKIATNSSSAGHRGIDSIITHLKTKKFKRVRLGIKNELLRKVIPTEKFVLQSFDKAELETLKKISARYRISDL